MLFMKVLSSPVLHVFTEMVPRSFASSKKKTCIQKVNAIIQERVQCGSAVLPFQNPADWFYFEQCTAIKENIDGN